MLMKGLVVNKLIQLFLTGLVLASCFCQAQTMPPEQVALGFVNGLAKQDEKTITLLSSQIIRPHLTKLASVWTELEQRYGKLRECKVTDSPTMQNDKTVLIGCNFGTHLQQLRVTVDGQTIAGFYLGQASPIAADKNTDEKKN